MFDIFNIAILNMLHKLCVLMLTTWWCVDFDLYIKDEDL